MKRSLSASIVLTLVLLCGGWWMSTSSPSGETSTADLATITNADIATSGELRQAMPAPSAMQQPRQTRTLSQNTSARQSSRTLPNYSSAHKAYLPHSVLPTLGGRYANRHHCVRSRLARWYYVIALRHILC